MEINPAKRIFMELERWTAETNNDENVGEPLEASVLSDFRNLVVQALFKQKRDDLRVLKHKASPLRARLQPRIKNIEVNVGS